MLNKIILLGRLVRDPEVKYTQNGKVVTSVTLAVDRVPTNDGKKEADFIPCVIWGKTAEVVGNYVKKGQRLLVEGSLRVRSYDDKNGSKRYVTEVLVQSVDFIEKKDASVDTGSGSGNFESMGTPVSFNEEVVF